MKHTTRQDYGERIGRVASHIAANPDDANDLDSLAALAHFSRWHFHRVYRAIMGETVAETVRRVRLHRAAGTLVQGNAPIPEIARQAGYGSAEAFTRAFASSHGITPAAYRARGVLHPLVPAAPHNGAATMYDVKFETLTPLAVAAVRHVGPYLDIGPVFERLFAWAAARNLMSPQTRCLGIYYDDPSAVPPERCRSEACLLLPEGVMPEGEARRLVIAGGRHACILHKGPYVELEGAYRWLYHVWLPQSGEEPADQPIVEEYLNNPREHPPSEWLTAIRLPLKSENDR